MIRRAILLTALVLAAATAGGVPALASTAPATHNSVARAIAQENETLLPALRAAGGQRVGNFMLMPDGSQLSVTPMALSDCASGAVCLWSEASFTGRMLSFRAAGSRESMGNYGFNDQMTSWANRTSNLDARWFYDGIESGIGRCMNPGTSSSNVGTTDNDKMSGLSIYTNSTTC